MAYTHLREAGQVAIFDVPVELALPFVVAPQVRIVLVEAPQIDVGQRSERGVQRGDLHFAHRLGIHYWNAIDGDAADVVYQEAVVADSLTSLQYGIEDIALLLAERRIGGGVVARAGQHIGG